MTAAPWLDRSEYPFASHWLPVAGGKLHYIDEGPRGAPVVLLVHGTPSWSFDFRHVVAELRSNYRVIALDHIGFGLSDKPRHWAYTPAAHSGNLRALLQHLAIERYSLVAHDMGGAVALPLAIEAPERVRSITVLNSWAWPFSETDPAFGKLLPIATSPVMRLLYRHAAFSPRVMLKASWGKKRPLTAELHRHYLAPFAGETLEGTVGFLMSMRDSDGHLARLWRERQRLAGIKAQVIWGMADSFVKPLHMARWLTIWPTAEVVQIADAGHFVQDEAAPEVATALRRFLSTL